MIKASDIYTDKIREYKVIFMQFDNECVLLDHRLVFYCYHHVVLIVETLILGYSCIFGVSFFIWLRFGLAVEGMEEERSISGAHESSLSLLICCCFS